MSSSLVRQALAFVEGEEKSEQKKRQGKKTRPQEPNIVRDLHHPYRRKNKKPQEIKKSEQDIAEENIKKLLALSKPTANSSVAEKIVERAVKRKPLLEKIDVKKDDHKSILFPGESYKSFEKEYFCS